MYIELITSPCGADSEDGELSDSALPSQNN